ncbi:MAG: DUF4418 family protein [Muricomes sp.]
MKDKTITGISLVVLGAMISFGPKFLMSGHCLEMKMKCFWTSKAEFYIGFFIMILALSFLYFEAKEMRMSICLSLALFGILSAIMVFNGFCNGSCGSECSCSSVTSLVMIVLSVLVSLISAVNFMTFKKNI